MKKILLILGSAVIVISLIIIFAFRSWTIKVYDSMPADGKAIFSQINPELCSSSNCVACTVEVCEQKLDSCVLKEYQWASEGKTFKRMYCAQFEGP